ncbi:MAG: hypothetical protein PHI27_06330 [Eubacteriales bacterium]|nr:hypothetical protein [Eubacteriales bacterium]MDD3881851.1 hypothetical protein [Eubacteriales bacterium]MDD4512903.1 hypothetical protein [Eubacteriales bacterium]
MYRTEVISYSPKARKLAEAIECKANELEKEGFSLVSFTATGSAKAVLVFHKDGTPADEKPAAE